MRPRAFIIHGRDHEAVDELVKFFRAVGVDHLSFYQVAGSMGAAPFVADIVLKGIMSADVVIALFTPDEQAALYDPPTGRYAGDQEGEARWQARPNVIFEAGVAFGLARNRTILATLGADVRLFSDVAGVHFVVLHDRAGKSLLFDRLRAILPDASLRSDWATADSGDFRSVLRRRWPHFDELATLEHHLTDCLVGRPPVPLLQVFRKAVIGLAPAAVERLSAEKLIRRIRDVSSDAIADNAFWWGIVYGVLRFEGIKRWFTGDHWTGGIENAIVSERGVALLLKLASS